MRPAAVGQGAPADAQRRLRRAYWIIMAEGTLLVAGLIAGAAYLRTSRRSPSYEAVLVDPALRARALQDLVEQGSGDFDSFPDADVGRIMLPGVDRRAPGRPGLVTNAYGMRERPYALPKPPGVTRIVVLGDSFVFGLGIEAADRACAFLETSLRQRSGSSRNIECLQLGVSSWNIVAECAYLRRQLSELRPDVVVHLVVPNDLGDSTAVRGFGGPASFTDHHRERADGIVSGDHFRRIGFPDVPVRPLFYGLDYESRSRYAEAADDIRGLASAVAGAGGRYMLLIKWSTFVGPARDHLVHALPGVTVHYLPHRFSHAREHILSETNVHWNRAGNQVLARFLYGWLQKEGVLPTLGLAPWNEASLLYEEVRAGGEREAAEAPSGDDLARQSPLASSLDFGALARMPSATAAQIHGGVDREAMAAPYVSVILARSGAGRLVVSGTALARPEMQAAEVSVYADDEKVGTVRLQAGADFALERPLPPTVAGRPFLSVRLVTSDYVYGGPERRNCQAFRLRRIALVE
jgi:hypothetical protein